MTDVISIIESDAGVPTRERNKKPRKKTNATNTKNDLIKIIPIDNNQLHSVTEKFESINLKHKTRISTLPNKRVFVDDCCICTEEIYDNNKIWFCEQCSVSIHLDCVNNWFGSRLEKDTLIWSCPICRKDVLKKPQFRCYCGKVTDPIKSPLKESGYYYSCGNSCGRSRPQQKLCSHRCVDCCHPGACKQCNATVSRKCFCEKTHDNVRCSMLDISSEFPFNFACENVCGKLKNCSLHSCSTICHPGLCEDCDIIIAVATCFSHRTTRNILCGQPSEKSYSCNEKCNKLLPCGNHSCNEKCHEGSCALCITDVDSVVNCGCGKTRLDTLDDPTRKSCLDPIPTCNNICSKILKCSSSNEVHKCTSKCHNGACPPCMYPKEAYCRCGSKLFKTTCHSLNETVLKCNKRCKVMKQCHRHKCDNFCCDIPPSHHLCTLACGALLECSKHKCTKSCHPKGLCGKCDHYENQRVECVCGKVSVPPPILCGSKIPSCDQLCPNPQPCGHPQTHKCHLKNETCSRCCYPTEKYCNCGKVKQKNVPCYEDDVSCSLVCGKILPCSNSEYPHYCPRPCHKGSCCELPYADSKLYFLANPSKQYRIIPGTQELKCTQLCKVVRSCGHPCNLICHNLTVCPTTRCSQEVLVSCDCGELVEKWLCHTLVEKTNFDGANEQIRLECDEDCRLVLRNKKLAEALNLDVVSHFQGFYPKKFINDDCPEYSEFLLNSKTNHKLIVVAVEELFSKAVNRARAQQQSADELEVKLKVQTDIFTLENKNIWRRIIHEYSEHFGCYYYYRGNDCIIIITVRNSSKIPKKLLSSVPLYRGEKT